MFGQLDSGADSRGSCSNIDDLQGSRLIDGSFGDEWMSKFLARNTHGSHVDCRFAFVLSDIALGRITSTDSNLGKLDDTLFAKHDAASKPRLIQSLASCAP